VNQNHNELSLHSQEEGHYKKKRKIAGHQWLTPVILATQQAEIRRIVV
jgi:hypothetical protein